MRITLRELDPGLPAYIETWTEELNVALFPSLTATISLGELGAMGAMLSITGIFGMAAYSVSRRLREFGIRMALGARRKEVLEAALGRALKLLAFGSAAGFISGPGKPGAGFDRVSGDPRDPVVMARGSGYAAAGPLATWIRAQRVRRSIL